MMRVLASRVCVRACFRLVVRVECVARSWSTVGFMDVRACLLRASRVSHVSSCVVQLRSARWPLQRRRSRRVGSAPAFEAGVTCHSAKRTRRTQQQPQQQPRATLHPLQQRRQQTTAAMGAATAAAAVDSDTAHSASAPGRPSWLEAWEEAAPATAAAPSPSAVRKSTRLTLGCVPWTMLLPRPPPLLPPLPPPPPPVPVALTQRCHGAWGRAGCKARRRCPRA